MRSFSKAAARARGSFDRRAATRPPIASHATIGIVDKYGDGLGEYIGDVAEECFTYCDLGNARAQVGSVGLTDAQRTAIDNALIAAIADTIEFDVATRAIRQLSRTLDRSSGMTSARQAAIHDAIRNASMPGVRISVRVEAIRALGRLHDPADRELLRTIMKRDTTRVLKRGQAVRPVADAARRALGISP